MRGGIKVLLLDDDPSVRRLCSRMLARLGALVSPAATLAEARGLARRGDFDLLVSDLGLPDGNGFEFIAEFQSLRPGRPVIVITGSPEAEDEGRAGGLGVRGYLKKPFAVEVFKRALEKAIEIIP